MSDLEKVRRYAALKRRQSELETQLNSVKADAAELEQELLEFFAAEAVQSMNVDGHTVYLQGQLWAQVADGYTSEDVVSALKDVGLEHMVGERYNAQTLSAFLRDLEREGEELPPELDKVLVGRRRWSVRVRHTG